MRAAFLNTTYGTENERFSLGDLPGLRVSWAARGQVWAVLTSWNPEGRPIPREENLWRGERLRRDLTTLGLPFFEGMNGEGEWAEFAYIVCGLSLHRAVLLGAKYGQAAVLWGVGRRVALAWCASLRVERRWVAAGGSL